MTLGPEAEEQADEAVRPTADDRGIGVGRDANGNAFVTGDNNQVRVVIYQSVTERREVEPQRSAEIGPNPYMGLLAFHEEDADRFFGREEQIQRLWSSLRELQQSSTSRPGLVRFLPILGPSGCGKSSLVRAGLIPELARRSLPGWRDTRVAVLTPGSHPLEALAGVLARIATGDQAPLAKTREFTDELKRQTGDGTYDGLRRTADILPEIDTVRLIVLVDQFEEIYSLCKDKSERVAFIENLLHAASDASGRVTVLVTLRTDFLGETQTHEALNRVICGQQVMVPAMSAAELRAAIAKPAELAGHALDDATITLLVGDAKDREGALPLLQFALTRIWDGLARGVPPAETYRRIGGVGGALAGEAQRIYDQLDPDEQRIAKRVFLGLVQLGEGTRDTRRRAVVRELVSVGEDISLVEQVIRRFADRDARLITLSSSERGAADTAEVTHEALFDHWDQLNQWLDKNRDDLRFSRRVDEAARIWDQQGRPEGGLWLPPNLDLLRQYHERVGSEMSPLQMDFYLASVKAEDERAQAKRREELRLRQRTLLATIAAGVAFGLLGVSGGLLWYSTNVSRRAQEGEIRALTDAILLSPPKTAGEQITRFEKAVTSHSLRQFATQQLQGALGKATPGGASRDEETFLARGKANLAVALTRLGEIQLVLPQLRPVDGDPTLRSYLIHRFSEIGVAAESITAQLDAALDPSVLQALILSLGEFDEVSFPSSEREPVIGKLRGFYETHSDPGVHAASEWLLRQWGQTNALKEVTEELTKANRRLALEKIPGDRGWYVNSMGQTMVIAKGPVTFEMGSPESEVDRSSDERLHEVRIGYSFAIADKEVTRGDFWKFVSVPKNRDLLGLIEEEAKEFEPTTTDTMLPVVGVTWYWAAAYCNWLTEQELPDEDDARCYVANTEGKFGAGMTIEEDFLKRPGYRLPTEAEWEYACRAMTKTRWSHGEAEELLGKYARYNSRSAIAVGQLKPNAFGLFDMQGNAWEWCQDVYHQDHSTDTAGEDLVAGNESRVLRGGSFDLGARNVRAACRDRIRPGARLSYGVGFRVARTYH